MSYQICKHRRLRFSLRTMFALIMLVALGVHLVATLKVVRNRAHVHHHYPVISSYTNPGPTQPPLLWRLFGATATSVISLRPTATANDVARLERLFPEARVIVLTED